VIAIALSTRARPPSQWSSFMSNRTRNYEEPLDDAIEAEVESEFRFNLAQARKNIMPRGIRKVPVTIFLDEDIVAHFKQLADRSPTVSYQTQINQALREAITQYPAQSSADELLNDPRFAQLLDERIKTVAGKSKKTSVPRKRRAA
jgi:uncharacterized protein (DUF4415 family)